MSYGKVAYEAFVGEEARIYPTWEQLTDRSKKAWEDSAHSIILQYETNYSKSKGGEGGKAIDEFRNGKEGAYDRTTC
jgi:hypothetical protein